MRVRHLAVSITAAAAMGAFGPAFAQTTSSQPSTTSQSQSTARSTTHPDSASSGGSYPAPSASTPNASSQSQGTVSSGASAETDDERMRKGKGLDGDRAKGLDRADQGAGEHGQQGRDNAREKQD